MRPLLFFSAFLLGTICHAQYTPMPTTIQTTWKQINTVFGTIKIQSDNINAGDTLIANKRYQKVYKNTVVDSNYVGAYRDDGNGKVFFIGKPGSVASQEILLYDFTLEVGDTIDVIPLGHPNLTKMTPINIGCVLVKNVQTGLLEERKSLGMRWLTNTGNGEWGHYTWIEGLGSTRGLLTRGTPFGWDFNFHLTNIYQFGDSIINYGYVDCSNTVGEKPNKSKERFSLYPNPTTNLLYIKGIANENDFSMKIFSIDGKMMIQENKFRDHVDVSKLKSGIYTLVIESIDGIERKNFVKRE